MAAIELSGLTKHYGDVVALSDVDLVVEEGEIFGFLGPNGAGKSTTIDLLLDFVRPTGGTATVLGFDAQRDSLAVRRRVGVLPDGYRVYDRLTGREHLAFAIRSKGTDDDPAELLERVGIPEAIDRRAGDYSKGMRQRLVLAMALVGDPDLLILDEPSTGLDPRGAREMRDIIRAERDRGATVFFSSHILEQVEAVCDRVGILDEGELVTVDSVEGLRESVSAGTAMTVEVAGEPSTEALVDAVAAVAGVTDVTADGDHLGVRCDRTSKALVLNAIEDVGATVVDFDVDETSLEDLFMTFTAEPDVVSENGAEPDAAPEPGVAR